MLTYSTIHYVLLYHLDEPSEYWSGPSYILPDFTVAQLFRVACPSRCSLARRRSRSRLSLAARWHHRRAQPERGATTRSLHRDGRQHRPDLRHRAALPAGLRADAVLGAGGGWGGGGLSNKIGPIVTLALPQIAIVARLTRGSMIEALRSNHVRTARALGLSGGRSSSSTRFEARSCRSSPMPGRRQPRFSPARSSWRRFSRSPALAATSSMRH